MWMRHRLAKRALRGAVTMGRVQATASGCVRMVGQRGWARKTRTNAAFPTSAAIANALHGRRRVWSLVPAFAINGNIAATPSRRRRRPQSSMHHFQESSSSMAVGNSGWATMVLTTEGSADKSAIRSALIHHAPSHSARHILRRPKLPILLVKFLPKWAV